MDNKASEWLNRLLVRSGIDKGLADQMESIVALFVILLIAVIVNFILKHILLKLVGKFLKRFSPEERIRIDITRILRRVADLMLAGLVFLFLPAAFPAGSEWLDLSLRICAIVIVILILLLLDTATHMGYHIAGGKEKYRRKPIKGFFQILQILLYFIGVIVIVSILINKSPAGLLTGLGAFAAVLSFIFKDTILGFIAGIQLSSNDMIRPGDWITVQNTIADGVVIDITLITVKIQNFDNTIITVPTYSLITTPFQNWRGMTESGGRRITLNFNINLSTVRFTDDRKNVTNLRLYRMHLTEYITKHPQVNRTQTFMIRYLAPGPQGIPMQVYCFSKNTEWVIFEAIKAEIAEYVIASAPEFGLDLYQIAPPETGKPA